ncbi:MAG: hypothetical protein ABI758_00340 [Candidatus Woesebacteria bacterium]
MAKNKKEDLPSSQSEKQRIEKRERIERQVNAFIENSLESPEFIELSGDIERYMTQFQKRDRYMKLETRIATMLTTVFIAAECLDPNFHLEYLVIPMLLLLFHVLYQADQLGDFKTGFINGELSMEREAIIQKLDDLHLYIAGGPATHFKHLQNEMSEHGLIQTVYETHAEKRKIHEQHLLTQYQMGRLNQLINTDGELCDTFADEDQNIARRS